MSNKILLSIAIPTWNRALCLKDLLNNIMPQAAELKGEVEICISNNGSTDNTHEVVANFNKKYPDLIKYNENKENIGFNRNLLKVLEMAHGEFVWTFGDDDLVVDNGLKKAIDFIKNYSNENIGLITFARREYFVDKKSGKKVVWKDTIEKDKSSVYEISQEDIIGQRFIDSTFISVLLYNNNFLNKILKEEKIIIEKAIQAGDYIHTFIYRLMFLKYPQLQALRFNEKIIDQELCYYKPYIEDIFRLHHTIPIKLADLLLSSKYASDYYKKIIIDGNKGIRKIIINEMGWMRAFKKFNYFSYFGCLKLFFSEATFIDALLFSIFFVVFSIIPPVVFKNLCKILIKNKYKKEWQKIWLKITDTNSMSSKSNQRLGSF